MIKYVGIGLILNHAKRAITGTFSKQAACVLISPTPVTRGICLTLGFDGTFQCIFYDAKFFWSRTYSIRKFPNGTHSIRVGKL